VTDHVVVAANATATINGRTLITGSAEDWAAPRTDRAAYIASCLNRHRHRDWGDLDRDDWAANDRAVTLRAGRVFSTYLVPAELDPANTHLWIITDDLANPNTPTTILWPHEY
jgi:hypothetical protein